MEGAVTTLKEKAAEAGLSYGAVKVRIGQMGWSEEKALSTPVKSKKMHYDGRAKTRAYGCWRSMMKRCYDPKHEAYGRYGGAGILVCERWHRFENFLADMGEAPPGHSIDRKDNDKGYAPDNCRWATMQEQQNNRSTNVWLTLGDRTQTATQWAAELGMTVQAIRCRLNKLGWPVEKALTTPVKK
jgi:hypothetical protein